MTNDYSPLEILQEEIANMESAIESLNESYEFLLSSDSAVFGKRAKSVERLIDGMGKDLEKLQTKYDKAFAKEFGGE